ERIGAAHRDARRAAGHSHADGPEISTALSASDHVVFTWGFLFALEKIGDGSFGEVWRAWDPTLEREVALKLRRLAPAPEGTHPLARTSDPETRRWVDEARKLARVRHPNVLVVHGAAEHDGRAGLWTELVRGETLEHRLTASGP